MLTSKIKQWHCSNDFDNLTLIHIHWMFYVRCFYKTVSIFEIHYYSTVTGTIIVDGNPVLYAPSTTTQYLSRFTFFRMVELMNM